MYFLNLFILFLHTYVSSLLLSSENIYEQGLDNGVLNETCSSSGFQLVMGLYRGHPLFFFECVYFSLLYPSLIFDIFLSLCVCVCECVGVVLDFSNGYFPSVCVCVCV